MHGLEEKWGDRVNFVYLDIDDGRTEPFKQQLGYRYQPHFFLLNGQGEVIGQWVGYVQGEQLQRALHAALQEQEG